MRRRRRAEAIRRPLWAVVLCLAFCAPGALTGCSRSSAVTGPPEPEAVVVYPAQLVSGHPLYPEVAELSARIAAISAPPDLREMRALMSSPLGRRLLRPPRVQQPDRVRFTAWEAQSDAQLAADVQEAEESLGSWPDAELTKMEGRLSRAAADALREAENEAELARLRTEIGEIERHQRQFDELRRLAASEDREEAARAVERQAALWKEIGARVAAVEREADLRLRELRESGEADVREALREARDRAEADRAAHVRQLRDAGGEARERLPEAVDSATIPIAPAEDAQAVPPAPSTSELTALVGEVEAALRAARERRIKRLVAARGRLLREIALSTQSAVQAVAIRNGVDVHLEPDADAALRDATEDFRPLLREYWATRPAIAGADAGPRH